MPQGGATFVLELSKNLIFFLKIRRAKIVRTTSTTQEKDRKKSTTAYYNDDWRCASI